MGEKDNKTRLIIQELLSLAGVEINGKNPWDPQVHNEQFYHELLKNPDLAFGETYMAGWWDCERIDLLVERILRANLQEKVGHNLKLLWQILKSRLINLQSKKRSLVVGKAHYDLGNDLYQAMLDSRMNYTCGYWKEAQTLDGAQLAKMDLSCRKLDLKPGMRLLDIGCGWGALAKHAATNFGVEVVGITISQQQYEWAKKDCEGLAIDIRFQDYRDIREPFDRIVSLGMFEHVGYKNYRPYLKIVHDCLKDKGLFLLHTIGTNESTTKTNAWINRYIFPNSMLPSIAQIGKASENLLVLEDWHSFGPDYARTLAAWHDNFNQHWPALKDKYGDEFYRMWHFYLMISIGGFKARSNQLWQIVFSKGDLDYRYEAAR